MTFDPTKLVNPLLLKIKPYQPGKPIAECQRELGRQEFIKLASNENPLLPSPLLIKQLITTISDLSLYPDSNGFELKNALSAFLKLSVDQIILGNGSEDVLRMVIQAFMWADKQILIPEFAFAAYKILAQGLGVAIKEVPAQQFGMDLEAMLKAITSKTGMIIFANPNNPTGTYVDKQALLSFLEKIPSNILVVCDEAYYEYMTEHDYPQTINLLARFANLFITRTFSKAYGLAGLRIGYGMGNASVIALMNRIRQPFNTNHLAQVAATLALADQARIKQCIQLNECGKQQLTQGLAQLNLSFLPCHGNFVSVEIKMPNVKVFEALLAQGIIIRPLAPYGMEDYFRITIGTSQQNAACLQALETILKKEKVV
ncbi:MAG: histidinol-phosphate transaminase [Proteobacteria bacterium]|nr:histidinol-phosphate transaminase [Pseudomonadota bacterium]